MVAATSVELVHLATLYHDDVMDEATLRRGAESANARWDNTVAILTGDYLFAHASRLVSQLGPDAVRIIAETFAELVTGQMRETRGPRDGEDAVEHYLAVVAEKTGSLIATSGRFGAMFAGAPDEHVTAMRRFGEIIGTVFQVSDDIIDIASPSGDSGKTPGTDLREGVATLPVLYTLAGDGPEVARLRALGVGSRELADERGGRGPGAAARLGGPARGPRGPRRPRRRRPRRARRPPGRPRPPRPRAPSSTTPSPAPADPRERISARIWPGTSLDGAGRRASSGEDDQRRPDEADADPAGHRHGLAGDDHAPQELQGRVDVLQHAQGGQGQAPGAGGEEQQRDRRHRPGGDEQQRVARAEPGERARAGDLEPDEEDDRERAEQEALGGQARDRLERDPLLDQPVQRRS